MADFLPGLQTSFNARIPAADLEAVQGFGFRWVRQDALECDTATMIGMLEDADACELRTLTIVFDLNKLGALPPGRWAEWGNELDFTMPPREYRDSLEDACDQALESGIRLVGPCISNLDQDSLRWLERVRGKGWPDGLAAVSVHRYGDGHFLTAHPGFANRADEVKALTALCDGLPWLVTEFGYKTQPGLEQSSGGFVSEADQAAFITLEWTFWRNAGAIAALLYQLNDGPDREVEGFGIRWCEADGSPGAWKASASTLLSG